MPLKLVTAKSGDEALRCVLKQDFAVILMDARMPGVDGFETARLIRERERSRHTPIIFLTSAYEDTPSVTRGSDSPAGAQSGDRAQRPATRTDHPVGGNCNLS
jgi:two-component system, sporulation sensor kinase E